MYTHPEKNLRFLKYCNDELRNITNPNSVFRTPVFFFHPFQLIEPGLDSG